MHVNTGATSCGLEPGLVEPSQAASVLSQPVISQSTSQAANQGVFSTMMAASKYKSKPVALSSSGNPASAEDTCCRSQEEQLLARIFASQASSSAVAVVLSGSSSQRLRACSTQAQPVSPSCSLWACAGRSDPPGCRLQERVQKRKAEAAMQAEVVKQQRAEQQRAEQQRAEQQRFQQSNNTPDVALQSSQSDMQRTALCELSKDDDVSRCSKSTSSAEAADCTVLTSPPGNTDNNSNEGRCMSSQPVQPALQQAYTQTMDPMKRMRLQALQQELKAAKQTVADLELMIKAEELS